MNIYDKTGDVNIRVDIGSIRFNILLTQSFFNPNANRTSNNHNHSLYEVHFVDSGTEELLICEEKTLLLPGTYFLISPGVYHAHKFSGGLQGLQTYCMRFEFAETSGSDSFISVNESREIETLLSNFKYFHALDNYNSIGLIREIHREFDRQQLGYYSRIQSLFVQIIINLLRAISSEEQSKAGLRGRTIDERRSEIIEHFFSENYNTNITPAQLAESLRLSHSQMNRILKKLYGVSFKQKLLETRIEIAKDLLIADETPVHIIAEKTGYFDASCFCSIFKSRTGISPSDYRLMHRLSEAKKSGSFPFPVF